MNDQDLTIQKNMLYNTVGSLVYYICQWVMTVVIVHISGYEATGILALAMTVCASPAIVSLFNVRSYQVSDIQEQYSAKTYIRSRRVSNLLAYFVCICMVFIGGYNLEKSAVILMFMLYKLAEGTADVYYGIEQRWGRLDYAGISMSLRGIGTIVVFVIVQYLWNNLLLSIAAITVCSYAVILIYDRQKVKQWTRVTHREEWENVYRLLVTCIPLAIVAFLNNFSINLPKISLENTFGSEVMGFFSSVTSPTNVVQMAASTIFAPLITPLTSAFVQKDWGGFYGLIRKFLILLCALSVLSCAGAALLGRWGLNLLYGPEIDLYVYVFVPGILVSVLLAVNASLLSICTLIREIKTQYIVGITGFVAAAIFSYTIVPKFSMNGVVIAQAGTMMIQIVLQLVIIANNLKKAKGK